MAGVYLGSVPDIVVGSSTCVNEALGALRVLATKATTLLLLLLHTHSHTFLRTRRDGLSVFGRRHYQTKRSFTVDDITDGQRVYSPPLAVVGVSRDHCTRAASALITSTKQGLRYQQAVCSGVDLTYYYYGSVQSHASRRRVLPSYVYTASGPDGPFITAGQCLANTLIA